MTPRSTPSGQPASETAAELPRHRTIYEELLQEIRSGTYRSGDRLPSEAMLCQRFNASRITVAKAIQTLQRERLVSRRPGSGTYVDMQSGNSALQFGLLIPELGTTEIFEPICQGMMRSPLGKSHSLIWGHYAEDEADLDKAAEHLCRQYIAQRVSGVFFAPLEYTETRHHSNRRITSALRQAGIPVVLLDRCLESYPRRSGFDLVGIDNHRAGYILTSHLLQHGATRIVFAARPNSAATVDERAGGYFAALRDAGTEYKGSVQHLAVIEPPTVQAMIDRERPDAIVCANDLTAARLMKALEALRISIPEEIRLVGVDDVAYAKFLPVPLTTLRQNCAEIGAAAMSTMLERVERPNRPARDILIQFELIVRSSCGAHQARGAALASEAS